jgi:chromosome segregation ATPase
VKGKAKEKFAEYKEGSDLDEFNSHRFLESVGETLTVVELRKRLEGLDLDKNRRLAISEYLLSRYGKTPEQLVNAPGEGENKTEIEKASQKVAEANAAVEQVQRKLEEQKTALEEQKQQEASARKLLEEQKVAEAAAQKALDDQKTAEAAAKQALEDQKTAEAAAKQALEEAKKCGTSCT